MSLVKSFTNIAGYFNPQNQRALQNAGQGLKDIGEVAKDNTVQVKNTLVAVEDAARGIQRFAKLAADYLESAKEATAALWKPLQIAADCFTTKESWKKHLRVMAGKKYMAEQEMVAISREDIRAHHTLGAQLEEARNRYGEANALLSKAKGDAHERGQLTLAEIDAATTISRPGVGQRSASGVD